MKKSVLTVALVLTLGGSIFFTSCIGRFALTNKIISWNNQVSNKFVNELVFIAFWILPVYEVTSLADLLVINSIEFWSGTNPVEASTKVIDTESGRYLVECDGKGYTITNETTGESARLNFNEEDKTWSVNANGVDMPFMTFVDDTHVKMISPDGSYRLVELSEAGVMAYSSDVMASSNVAMR